MEAKKFNLSKKQKQNEVRVLFELRLITIESVVQVEEMDYRVNSKYRE